MVTIYSRNEVKDPKFTVRIAKARGNTIYEDVSAKTLTRLRKNAYRYMSEHPNVTHIEVFKATGKRESVGTVAKDPKGLIWSAPFPKQKVYYLNRDGTLGRRY